MCVEQANEYHCAIITELRQKMKKADQKCAYLTLAASRNTESDYDCRCAKIKAHNIVGF